MWSTVKLEDVASIFTDDDWIETKNQSKDGIRLVQTGNIKVDAFANKVNKARYISQETFERLKCTEIFEGDILVSRLPDPIGRACILPALRGRAITAVDCTVIRVKNGILPKFLNCYMQSSQYFSNVQKRVTGATRQRISRKHLADIPVNIPPLPEQQRIVARLDAAFAQMDRALALVDTKTVEIEKLQTALLTHAFGADSADAASWKVTKLGDVCDFVRGLTYSKKDEIDQGGIAVLRATNIDLMTHKLVFDEIRYVSRSVSVKPNKYTRKGDILICTASGSKSHLGKVAIVKRSLNMTFGGFMAVLRCKPQCLPEFLFMFLISQRFLGHLANLSDGSNINNLKFSQIEHFSFSLPPIPEQQRIVARLDAAFAHLDTAKQAIAAIKTHYTALKSALLSQELRQNL